MAKIHYHIRWSTKAKLDWQTFDTAVEAEGAAGSMVQLGETFTIEEADENCSRCTEPAEPKPAQSEVPKARKHGTGR